LNDVPKFLVEWSSPWEEFLSAVRPALGRSPERLAGEARVGLFPYRGILVSWVLEAAVLIAVIVIPARMATMRTFAPPPMPKYDVIYFSGDELPRTEDLGGARAGKSGRAGGQEAHHRTQTIRVARGDSLRDKVVDAPKLNLPKSDTDVANLLAYKPIPGPAPTEGLKSSLRAPRLADVTPVAPTPQVSRNKIPAAPSLNAGVIPPAPAPIAATMRLPGSQAVEVIPPPVSAPEQVTNLNPKLTLPMPTVVAPPPQVTRDVASLGPGFGAGDMHKQVIPPPAQLSGNTVSSQHGAVGGLGTPSVVPPPAQIGGGSLSHQPVSGLGGGDAVVPPPPAMGGGSSLSGRGRGNQGTGLGGPLDVGVASAPPKGGGGSGGGTGVVVSSQPGSKVGVPGNGGTGSLAMSPSGGSKPGLGGSGGGTGIGRGNGPGSGLAGEGSGATKEGTGRGSDVMAKGGISPYPGPGGAGSGTNGTPAMPGVSVRGGSSNVVNLPSFGSDPNQPAGPGRSSTGSDRHSPGITIIATSRSGGAFNFYGALKGDNYSIYIETALGTAVMQFADPTSAEHAYSEAMVAPEPLRTDLPAGLTRARLIIACILDRTGLLKNARVLEAGPSEMTTKVLAALPNWKFQPVLRGGQPVEVNAILGFNIDTR
jgi:hypothetical protein